VKSLPQCFFQLAERYPAFSGDTVIDEKDRHAPVVEVVQAIVGVDVGQLGIVTQRAEEPQRFVAEVAALAGDQDQPHASTAIDDCAVWGLSDSRDRPLWHQSSPSAPPGAAKPEKSGRLGRQPEALPHLDRRALQAIRLLDVIDTDPHIIRRIACRRDRPERVPRLHHHRRVVRLPAPTSAQRERDAQGQDGGDRRQQSPPRAGCAAGSVCPPRFDSDAGGVHMFGSIANARLRVKMPNKGLHFKPRSASMASTSPTTHWRRHEIDRSTD